MKPLSESAAFSRPNLSDSGGPIQSDRRLSTSVSEINFFKAQRLARLNEVSMGWWLRFLVDRETAFATFPENERSFCAENINGIDVIVHNVKRKQK